MEKNKTLKDIMLSNKKGIRVGDSQNNGWNENGDVILPYDFALEDLNNATFTGVKLQDQFDTVADSIERTLNIDGINAMENDLDMGQHSINNYGSPSNTSSLVSFQNMYIYKNGIKFNDVSDATEVTGSGRLSLSIADNQVYIPDIYTLIDNQIPITFTPKYTYSIDSIVSNKFYETLLLSLGDSSSVQVTVLRRPVVTNSNLWKGVTDPFPTFVAGVPVKLMLYGISGGQIMATSVLTDIPNEVKPLWFMDDNVSVDLTKVYTPAGYEDLIYFDQYTNQQTDLEKLYAHYITVGSWSPLKQSYETDDSANDGNPMFNPSQSYNGRLPAVHIETDNKEQNDSGQSQTGGSGDEKGAFNNPRTADEGYHIALTSTATIQSPNSNRVAYSSKNYTTPMITFKLVKRMRDGYFW